MKLTTNEKPCGDCAFFVKDSHAKILGTCHKKLMAVVATMHASWNEHTGGPCFVPDAARIPGVCRWCEGAGVVRHLGRDNEEIVEDCVCAKIR